MQKNNRTNDWIEDWTKASYQLLTGNILEAFAPLDFYHFYPLWFDLWFEKIYQAIDAIEKKNIPRKKVLQSLPIPSSIRAIIFKLIAIFPHIKIEPEKVKKVLNFLFNALDEICVDDPFGHSKNIVHSKSELEKVANDILWEEADPEIAKKLPGFTCLASRFAMDCITISPPTTRLIFTDHIKSNTKTKIIP